MVIAIVALGIALARTRESLSRLEAKFELILKELKKEVDNK